MKSLARQPKKSFAILIAVLLAILIAGSILFTQIEKWRFLDSLYFTANTLAKVGYGDIVPATAAGKVLAMILSVLSIVMILWALFLALTIVRAKTFAKG